MGEDRLNRICDQKGLKRNYNTVQRKRQYAVRVREEEEPAGRSGRQDAAGGDPR